MSEEYLQCPCGRVIKSSSDYKLLFLKKDLMEIDILCPNDACFLRELGYVRFKIVNGVPKLEKAKFYPPYVTWNIARLGREKAVELLKRHLAEIVVRIDWDKVARAYAEKEKS